MNGKDVVRQETPQFPIREITENDVAKVPGQWASAAFPAAPPATVFERFEQNGWTPKIPWPPIKFPNGAVVTLVYFKCERLIEVPGKGRG